MTSPARKPSAAARTVSLFTGKTDLEDPARGRDGCYAEPKPYAPRPDPGAKWKALSDGWHWVRGGQAIRCRESAGVLSYELHHGGAVAGTFRTIVDAAKRADELMWGSRR